MTPPSNAKPYALPKSLYLLTLAMIRAEEREEMKSGIKKKGHPAKPINPNLKFKIEK